MAAVALIPAYNPDMKMVGLVEDLHKKGFDIIIVNDGSDPSYKGIFDECRDYACIIGYDRNIGKGHALKYGMSFIRENRPGSDFFITADADGQHSVKDICRMRKELEDGADFAVSVRNLKGRNAPFWSKVGNGLSRFMFTIANAHFLPDNQSGLRGFSVRHIDWMLKVKGDKYDYELNIILFAEKQGLKISRIPIETIYFDNNAGTHFRVFEDTLLIYARYFETNIFVVISVIMEFTAVLLATILSGYTLMPFVVMGCWGLHALMCLVIERYTLFRWIRYTPGVRRLIISIFKYFVVFLICWGFQLIERPFEVPFAAAYVMGFLVVTIGEYYLLKVSYDWPE